MRPTYFGGAAAGRRVRPDVLSGSRWVGRTLRQGPLSGGQEGTTCAGGLKCTCDCNTSLLPRSYFIVPCLLRHYNLA